MDKDRPSTPIPPKSGKQMDDNIDDLGRRPDGSKQDQPGITKPSRDGGTQQQAGSGR
ncbi:MAG: hypothetical protein QM702_10630 [Rubrivivax sp.]